MGFFTSVSFAPTLEALILSREADNYEDSPASSLKMIPLGDVVQADYDEYGQIFTLCYHENEGMTLTIHIELSPYDISDDLRSVLQL